MIRSTTLQKLLKYHNAKGPQSTLGFALKTSLEKDAVRPVLLDAHYQAVDRRMAIILKVLRQCLKAANGPAEVIFSHDDLYDSGYDGVFNDKAFS